MYKEYIMSALSSAKSAKKIKAVSSETATLFAMFESLSSAKRRYLTERLKELLNDEVSEQKWEKAFESNPQPMLKMASQALREHRQGKSKRMN